MYTFRPDSCPSPTSPVDKKASAGSGSESDESLEKCEFMPQFLLTYVLKYLDIVHE